MNSRRFTSAETIPNSNSTRNPNILESNDDIDQELLLKRHIATHAMECTLDELGETNHNILFPQNSEPDISPITNTTSFTFPKIVQYMEIIKGTRRETPNVKKIKIFVDTLGPYMKLKPWSFDNTPTVSFAPIPPHGAPSLDHKSVPLPPSPLTTYLTAPPGSYTTGPAQLLVPPATTTVPTGTISSTGTDSTQPSPPPPPPSRTESSPAPSLIAHHGVSVASNPSYPSHSSDSDSKDSSYGSSSISSSRSSVRTRRRLLKTHDKKFTKLTEQLTKQAHQMKIDKLTINVDTIQIRLKFTEYMESLRILLTNHITTKDMLADYPKIRHPARSYADAAVFNLLSVYSDKHKKDMIRGLAQSRYKAFTRLQDQCASNIPDDKMCFNNFSQQSNRDTTNRPLPSSDASVAPGF